MALGMIVGNLSNRGDKVGNGDAAFTKIEKRVVGVKQQIAGGDDVLFRQVDENITVRVGDAGVSQDYLVLAHLDTPGLDRPG